MMRKQRMAWPLSALIGALVAGAGTACGAPPGAKAPEKTSLNYVQPTLEPVERATETQEKGQIVIQAAPVPITPSRGLVRSCTRVGSGNFLANVIDSKNEPKAEYEVRATPEFTVPELLEFEITVTNRTSQVLKLESTVLRLNVDDREVPVSTTTDLTQARAEGGGNKAFLEGVLAPGEKKTYSVFTPRWRSFPENATLLLGIYGVPTEMDAAGSVAKRENFEWAFKFKALKKSEEAVVAVSTEEMTLSQARACH